MVHTVERDAQAEAVLTFERDPATYRHWRVDLEGDIATVTMQVDPAGGLRPEVELKLNS